MTANAILTHLSPICESRNALHQGSECLVGNPFEPSLVKQAQYVREYSKQNNPYQ